MKHFSVWFSGAIAPLTLILLCASPCAHADTYTIYNLGNANYNTIYGIDKAGQVVTDNGVFCGSPGGSCYTTYADGVAVAATNVDIAPNLDWDNGTACPSTPSGFSVFHSVCNNGRMGFGSSYNANGDPHGLYTGPMSDLAFLQYGSGDKVVLNAAGDFAWVSGAQEYIYEAVDTSVPEPSTVLLLATGAGVFSFAIVRRKSQA
ncbi:MAG: PEP-CTERM sorting domain-containing protein [Acidobacteriota bacterium]|nr:PEP-CTERM sorting domain-containing protein [Acidobacteriota bacterium]